MIPTEFIGTLRLASEMSLVPRICVECIRGPFYCLEAAVLEALLIIPLHFGLRFIRERIKLYRIASNLITFGRVDVVPRVCDQRTRVMNVVFVKASHFCVCIRIVIKESYLFQFIRCVAYSYLLHNHVIKLFFFYHAHWSRRLECSLFWNCNVPNMQTKWFFVLVFWCARYCEFGVLCVVPIPSAPVKTQGQVWPRPVSHLVNSSYLALRPSHFSFKVRLFHIFTFSGAGGPCFSMYGNWLVHPCTSFLIVEELQLVGKILMGAAEALKVEDFWSTLIKNYGKFISAPILIEHCGTFAMHSWQRWHV